MNTVKEHVIKTRMSDEDINKINFCQDELNKNTSEIVRLAIDVLYHKIKNEKERIRSMTNLKFKETIKRKDTKFQDMHVWNYDELKEVLAAHFGDDVDEAIEDIVKGKVITVGDVYVQSFSLATSEDIEEAAKREAELNAFLDSIEIPEATRFMKTLYNED
jgi:hypothetical protein